MGRTRVFLVGMVIVSASAQSTSSRTNLNNCLNGLASCDISQLTPADVKTISDAAKSRNVNNCMNGLSKCDTTRLTQDEAKAVANAYARRNDKSCIDGLSRCDP